MSLNRNVFYHSFSASSFEGGCAKGSIQKHILTQNICIALETWSKLHTKFTFAVLTFSLKSGDRI